MTLVKICGNRSTEEVLAAAEAGADLVGMIFAESKRRVQVDDARAMVRALGAPLAEREVHLPPPLLGSTREEIGPWFEHGARVVEAYLQAKRPLTVGIFADQPVEEVNAIAEEVGVDLVQLSGGESWEDALLVTRPVIQVVHVSPIDSPSDPFDYVQPGFALALGLDSAHGPYRGGTGVPFDWEVARAVSQRMPMMLMGGLSPDNVEEAIRRVRPWIVDVATGTETDGRKDPEKVRQFIGIVRETDAALQEATP